MTETGKKRGALLTIWLIWMLIVNGGVALVFLLGKEFVAKVLPTLPAWAIYTSGILLVFNVIVAIFLFMWKKWAFFAYCGITVISLVIVLITGTFNFSSISGLLGPVVLYLIMRPKWELFE